MKRHIEPVKQLLGSDFSYHILGVTETRLGPAVDDNMLNIPWYSIIRQDRNTGGGRVALYMRDTLKVKILANFNTTRPGKPEFLNILRVVYGRVMGRLSWCFLYIDHPLFHSCHQKMHIIMFMSYSLI